MTDLGNLLQKNKKHPWEYSMICTEPKMIVSSWKKTSILKIMKSEAWEKKQGETKTKTEN